MRNRQWHPLNTVDRSRPETGQLVAFRHAVWRAVKVENSPLTDNDRDVWLERGMPDLDRWHQRPYKVTVEWVGGAVPDWAAGGDERKRGTIHIPAGDRQQWNVYPRGRWPQCSCCGEPVPCRADAEDVQVGASLDRIAKLEAIPVGACWSCSEPITRRQKAVYYSGENLYLPGGPQVQFHTRQQCGGSACRYEEKWVAADPRRERILTWPRCGGILAVHGDGSSECLSGRTPLIGTECVSQTGCLGHATHDHGVLMACYGADFGTGEGGCPRGCSRENHPGAQPAPRPQRREPSIGQLDTTNHLS